MKRYHRTHKTVAGHAPAAVLTPQADDAGRGYRWAQLLEDAVNTPGTIARCYSIFWSYSLGNQLAALAQCQARGIQPGPINTYAGWQALGRQVRRGERALTLCQPITVTRRQAEDDDADDHDARTIYVWKPRWFVLSQTDGVEYRPPVLPGWDRARAMEALNVGEVPFTHTNGNIQGVSMPGRLLAINPVAAHPERTLLHELGHIVAGHFEVSVTLDGPTMEVEAESIAYICADALGLGGADESRGYIQSWMARGGTLDEPTARRIFRATDAILRAGRAEVAPPLASAA